MRIHIFSVACCPGLLILSGLAGCSRPNANGGVPPVVANVKERPPNPNVPAVKFIDITATAGIKFTHTSGAYGKKLLPETLGGGCAFLDFDNDGKQDLLFINSCNWPGFEDKDKPAPTMALYRNLGDGRFEDVTAAVGLNVTFYGMGVAVGDYDNDGWADVFIGGVGGCHLYHNEPDGKGGRKFVEVTKLSPDLMATWNWPVEKGKAFEERDQPISLASSAAFLDYDQDGRLDLFVCNYVQWSPHYDLTQPFTLAGIGRAYGPPTNFPGGHCQLYRNVGGGKFENVTQKAGIAVFDGMRKAVGKSLGVIVCDIDEDGWSDIIVANDTARNFLFHNERDGTFKEIAQECGVAYADGVARGAMGADFAEYRPGKCAVLITNFANEPDTLLRMDDPKQLLFSDVAIVDGVAGPSRIGLRFGCYFFDYDLDGRLDYLTCNGHLEPEISKLYPDQHYKQRIHLFWNTGGRPCFELVLEDKVGPDLLKPLVGRGCAFADIDGNGTLDVVLMENGGPARLLKNEGCGNNWIRLALEGNGTTTNKSAIGARVIITCGKHVQKREVVGSRGYLSSSELSITFGLGKADMIDRVEIHWPGKDATPQVLTDLAINTTHRIVQK